MQSGLCYYKTGNGTPLILLHGVGLRAECWVHQFSAFSDRYQIYALDMPGHGQDQSDLPLDLDGYIKALHELITQEIKRPAMIIGHSMGALISVEFAAHYPELCPALIAMNTVFQRSKNAKAQIKARVEQLAKLTDPKELLAPIARWFDENSDEKSTRAQKMCEYWLLNTNLAGYSRAYSVFANCDGPGNEALAKLSTPAMFLTGEKDLNSTPQMSRDLAENCANGISNVVPDAAHMALLTHYEIINPTLRKYLDQFVNSDRLEGRALY